jgi:hypothetical protein
MLRSLLVRIFLRSRGGLMKVKKLARRVWFRLFIRWRRQWVPGWTLGDMYDFPNPPVKPCYACRGYSANVKGWDPKTKEVIRETSWEFCRSVNTCAATIDWDEVYGHGGS